MKILMVNKFLYPNGGSETYLFETGKQLQKMGHEVQYFGMEHEGRIVGEPCGKLYLRHGFSFRKAGEADVPPSGFSIPRKRAGRSAGFWTIFSPMRFI